MNYRQIAAGAGILVLLALGPTLAQEPETKEEMEKSQIARYEKKSISFFKTYYRIPMDQRHREVVEPAIRGAVELGRFDYNQIPLEVDNINELAQLVADYVDQVKVDRAKAQGREDYRFKDKLVTGADLERIIDSAYIYTPSVDKFEMEKQTKQVHDKKTGDTKTKHYWIATVGASVNFYHILPEYQDGNLQSVRVELLKTVSAVTTEEKEITILRPEAKAKWQAFESAVNNPFVGVARKIQIEVRRIAQFTLATQVASSGWNSIEFEFGKQSDVDLDHGYKVYEEVEGEGKQYIGYVKVRKVGDEKAQPPTMSRAQKIIQKAAIAPGTELQEYPQLLLNIYFRLGIFPLDHEAFPFDTSPYQLEESSFAPTLTLGVEYDLARFVGISELWACVEGHVGFGTDMLFYGVDGGLVKKFYFRRLGFDLGARVGWTRLSWDTTNLYGYEVLQDQVGVTPFGGLEVVITPSVSFTSEIGYRVYGSSDEWEYEGITEYPGEVKTSGIVITGGIMGMF